MKCHLRLINFIRIRYDLYKKTLPIQFVEKHFRINYNGFKPLLKLKIF